MTDTGVIPRHHARVKPRPIAATPGVAKRPAPLTLAPRPPPPPRPASHHHCPNFGHQHTTRPPPTIPYTPLHPTPSPITRHTAQSPPSPSPSIEAQQQQQRPQSPQGDFVAAAFSRDFSPTASHSILRLLRPALRPPPPYPPPRAPPPSPRHSSPPAPTLPLLPPFYRRGRSRRGRSSAVPRQQRSFLPRNPRPAPTNPASTPHTTPTLRVKPVDTPPPPRSGRHHTPIAPPAPPLPPPPTPRPRPHPRVKPVDTTHLPAHRPRRSHHLPFVGAHCLCPHAVLSPTSTLRLQSAHPSRPDKGVPCVAGPRNRPHPPTHPPPRHSPPRMAARQVGRGGEYPVVPSSRHGGSIWREPPSATTRRGH